ncbi:hypothetical protein KP509_03G039200 [Ceratopteris richardii]|uniref:Myb-like domain-containing protein n=2 Tax=Ceratopteris richardii TaxID=49495 RepID=A0A8T2UZ57_CERRI|nr:hypothetical protein KP509_03G039200 [Ceratopteris richardii]
METCSEPCDDTDVNSSPPRSCLDASVDIDTSSEEDPSESRCNESGDESGGDFAALSVLSGLPRNDDSSVETPLGESPGKEDQVVDAICRRTRAHLSLTDMSLDELETFLQESDEEDYFQNVDDEEEYRKFVAAVQGSWKEGSDAHNANGEKQAGEEEEDEDEDEEDDYDFEIELEEALESDYEELPKQEIITRKRRRRAVELGGTLKKRTLTERPLGSARTPLRPLLPSVSGRDASNSANKLFSEALHCSTEPYGFTPCQRRQLQCLLHEHVQLLVQVYSVTVLDPSRQQIAVDTQKLLLQLADAREKVLSWKRPFHPEICCCPSNTHSTSSSKIAPLVRLDSFRPRSPSDFINKHLNWREASCLDRVASDAKAESVNSTSPNLMRDKSAELSTMEKTSHTNRQAFTPTTKKVDSLLDITPLALVKDFLADVAKGVQEYRQQHLQISDCASRAQKPLFPAPTLQVAPAQNCQRKKTMAGSLVEDTKLNGIVLVPVEISAAASKFTKLFDPNLFPHKPPPAALAKRLLFTEAEDELLAMGLMRYNTNWDTIQQLLLPPKTTHQIFVRQKNRSTSRAPENSIKAVRRLKTSPLTKEEEACIEEGLKFFRSDWLKVWEHCVPYRDPATLSRLWRAAVGLQKSYNASEEAKEKHRIGEKMRRQKQALLKEQNDAANGELNSADEACEDAAGAYLHEAFIADYNSQPCSSASLSTTASQAFPGVQSSLTPGLNPPTATRTFLPALNLYNAPVTGNLDMNVKPSRRSGKRYRRSSFQIIKLAPGLPSLNLPRCVRVISQAKYNSQFSGHNSHVSTPRFCSGIQTGGSSGSGTLCNGAVTTANMHPLLMESTSEAGTLPSSMPNIRPSAYPVHGQVSTQTIPRFQPFFGVSKEKCNTGSKEVLPVHTESTRGTVELHPFLQDDGLHQNESQAPRGEKSYFMESCHPVGADVSTSNAQPHWSFFVSDSVIRPEPRRAVRVQDTGPNRSTSTHPKDGLNQNDPCHISYSKCGEITTSKSNTGTIDVIQSDKHNEEHTYDFINPREEENIVMEQEELSGSEEETEEVVQFECEEITDSENDESECRKDGPDSQKEEDGIQFEEEEIGSDDGDSEVGT